ncbi:MAG: acyl-CoA dehydrogenase family protein [Myxococcales bacterium]|nr:acyl-CoA dehydrogenase family protein [Myxococcales bacterium]
MSEAQCLGLSAEKGSSLHSGCATVGQAVDYGFRKDQSVKLDLFNPSQEHRMLRDMISAFTKEQVESQAAEYDQRGELNISLFRELARLGLMGITIPEVHGGAGLDAVASVIVHHELSKSDPGFCLAYLAHALLFVNNFYWASNDAQKKKYLEPTLSGEWVGGMGMTEPGHGTDVLGMSTTAVKKGTKYLVNGSKTYITNASEGDVFQVYAKTGGEISAFVVDRSCPGFSTSKPIKKMGMRGSTMGELIFEDCEVPAENLLGGEGAGLVHMMRNLEIERLALSAMSLGIADRCMEIMTAHSKERVAFGQPIYKFGQIQRYIADGYAMTEAARALVYYVAHNVGPEIQNRLGSDAAKLFTAPVGKIVADYAMQVLGGAGYCEEYPVERLFRDAKLIEIGGGTLESHQKNITKDLIRSL